MFDAISKYAQTGGSSIQPKTREMREVINFRDSEKKTGQCYRSLFTDKANVRNMLLIILEALGQWRLCTYAGARVPRPRTKTAPVHCAYSSLTQAPRLLAGSAPKSKNYHSILFRRHYIRLRKFVLYAASALVNEYSVRSGN